MPEAPPAAGPAAPAAPAAPATVASGAGPPAAPGAPGAAGAGASEEPAEGASAAAAAGAAAGAAGAEWRRRPRARRWPGQRTRSGGAAAGDAAGAAVGAAAGAEGGTGPIEIRCFGGFEVLCGDRRLSATGQAGPRHRSWEILAFLAAQPSEVVSTEKLLAAVWPDSDTERASSAFGAALSRLRGVLTHQLPGLSGPSCGGTGSGGRARLDGAAFASDVHAFASLCRDARRLPPAGSGRGVRAGAGALRRRSAQGSALPLAPRAGRRRSDPARTLPRGLPAGDQRAGRDLRAEGRAGEGRSAVPGAAAGGAIARGRGAPAVPLLRRPGRPGVARARAPPSAAGPARGVRRCRGGGRSVARHA